MSLARSSQRQLIAALALAMLAPSVSAQTDITERLKALVDGGQSNEAYELALSAQLENEGAPGFDYYFGVAAINAGKVDEGIFALERILVANPDNHLVRLELARGYFILGQYERAKVEFNTVIAADPPQQVKDNVAQFLDAIDKREASYKTKLSGFVKLGMGWDSNVNSAPGDPSFTTPTLGTGTLSAASVSDGDRFLSLTGGITLSHPINPQWTVFGNVQHSELVLESNGDFETSVSDLSAGAVWSRDDFSLKGTVGVQDYYLGHDRYRDAASLGLELAYLVNDRTRLALFGQGNELGYRGQATRNATMGTLGASVLFAPDLPLEPVISAAAYGGRETPHMKSATARAATDRDIKGANLSVTAKATPKTSFTVFTQWQESRYRETNAIFLVKRDDDFFAGGISVDYAYNNQLNLGVGWDYSETESNISINSFDRNRLTLSAQYSF